MKRDWVGEKIIMNENEMLFNTLKDYNRNEGGKEYYKKIKTIVLQWSLFYF